MRKSKNIWMYISIEVYLTGASEVGYWKSMNLPTGGNRIAKGFGRSPKQAYRNSFETVKYTGNVDTSTILSDYVFFLNGKEIYRSNYSDKLIKSNGSIIWE